MQHGRKSTCETEAMSHNPTDSFVYLQYLMLSCQSCSNLVDYAT